MLQEQVNSFNIFFSVYMIYFVSLSSLHFNYSPFFVTYIKSKWSIYLSLFPLLFSVLYSYCYHPFYVLLNHKNLDKNIFKILVSNKKQTKRIYNRFYNINNRHKTELWIFFTRSLISFLLKSKLDFVAAIFLY